jgi:YggT family protein
MPIPVRIIAWILFSLIEAYQMIMVVRAICSWIPPVRETKFFAFLRLLTEPLLSPIRELLNKLSWVRMIPLDFSFIVLYFLLSAISGVLIYLM